tara:strand:+ start:1472 stop:4390 length:2919 start_codon:yes stop_codon:yes gene_type:complete
MNIKDLELFKGISEKNSEYITQNSKLLTYKIGQPMSFKSIIQNQILIITEGTARLLSSSDENNITIAKSGPGSIIGLGSLLRVEACEEVIASIPTKVIAISDETIIKLFKEEEDFRKKCLTTIFPCEIINIAEFLIAKSSRTDINLVQALSLLLKFSELKIIYNQEKIKPRKDYRQIIASGNIVDRTIGSLNDNESVLTVRDPFPGRVIEIPDNLYDEFINKHNYINQENNKVEILETQPAPISPSQTLSNIGQYSPQIKTNIIRASGEGRETLACLEMLAIDLNLPFRKDSIDKVIRDEIRRGKKISMEMCASLMSNLGVYVSGTKIPSSLGNRLPTPSLVKWKNNFAVVKDSNLIGIKLASPSDGFVEIKTEELEDIYPDGIEVLIVERHSATPNKKFGLNWFLPSLKKYRGILLQVLIASFIVQLFGLANPLLIQVIIDKVISQRSLDTLQILGIALVVVTILGGIIGSLRTFLFTETTNRIDTRLGSEVIDHLLRLPLSYFDRRPVGELGSRVAELERIREFLTGQALTTILDAAFSVIYIVVMVLYSWLLTIIALGVVPIQIGLTLIGAPLLRRQIRESSKQNAKTQSHLVEVLTGVQTVKAQNVETVSRWKWQDLYGKYISRTFEKTITGTALGETSRVLQQLSQLLVLWIGASLVLSGDLTLGQLIAFRIISGYVTQPLLRLSSIWESVQQLRVSFERLADIIDTPEESIESDKSNIPLPEITGSVTFREVSFSFQKGGPEILKNVNLKIKPGEFIGIAGQSGSGKSTLMKLLPRLYLLEKGTILIDNYNINKVELYSLRRQVGIVPQDPLLFSGTVSENIALTDPDLTSDEIVRAAKIADAHDFIMELPMGYSTNVGERGAGLSGGQRQRIAIARTILSKPRMLIMDEATSALDYETERKVCENLRESCKGLTVFFITHRLSTIRNSEKIIMMHQGSISETGTHKELIEKKGRYYALYRQQEAN